MAVHLPLVSKTKSSSGLHGATLCRKSYLNSIKSPILLKSSTQIKSPLLLTISVAPTSKFFPFSLTFHNLQEIWGAHANQKNLPL